MCAALLDRCGPADLDFARECGARAQSALREFCKMYRSSWDGASPVSAARFFMVVARFRMRTRAFGLNQGLVSGAAERAGSRASAVCVRRGASPFSPQSSVTALSVLRVVLVPCKDLPDGLQRFVDRSLEPVATGALAAATGFQTLVHLWYEGAPAWEHRDAVDAEVLPLL